MFTILVTQRGRELALMRCVGATRRQSFSGVMLASLLAGLIASAAGVLAGLGIGWARSGCSSWSAVVGGAG
jgi:putative ABC transport system permease protein